jgi:hypothetical protein
MPNYGSQQSGVCLLPGDNYALFNAETPGAGQASMSFNRGYAPQGEPPAVTFTVSWTSAPTAAIDIQAANTDMEIAYQTLATLQNNQQDHYTDAGRWAYYRVVLRSYVAGAPLTVVAQL